MIFTQNTRDEYVLISFNGAPKLISISYLSDLVFSLIEDLSNPKAA
jgi:hypothetical protein